VVIAISCSNVPVAMRAIATRVVTSVATPGVPRVLTLAARNQNSRSRPSANRIRVPIIMIALSSGKIERIDKIVMIWRPRSPTMRLGQTSGLSAVPALDRPREWARWGVCRGAYQGHEAQGTTPQNRTRTDHPIPGGCRHWEPWDTSWACRGYAGSSQANAA
jgi:hypothetical protein